jgi:hypothetical protein
MMKPKFDDVLDYVKDGEVDPEMSELLDLDPDGQELLKQARFICKALREQYGESGSGRAAASFGDAMEDIGDLDVAALKAESQEPKKRKVRTFYQSAPLREPRRKGSRSLNRMLAGIDAERRDLGTLSFVVGEERISVSYEPSEVVASYAKKFGRKTPDLQLGLLGVQIQSMKIYISLPESIAVGDPITLQLSRTLRQAPARYLGLVFMPDTGPFVRFGSDNEGNAELPAPIQSGILRIETPESHFLQIEVEKP